jgi:hypothetical protein
MPQKKDRHVIEPLEKISVVVENGKVVEVGHRHEIEIEIFVCFGVSETLMLALRRRLFDSCVKVFEPRP